MTQDSYQVAGRTVTMPVQVRDASAAALVFDVDRDAAAALLPGDDFQVVETAPGRSQLTVALVDYRDNDLGDYHEVGLTLSVQPRSGAGDPGTFIYRLPVDQSFTCEAGRGIWGFPKTVEQIGFDYGDDAVTATLRMDGELVLRVTVPRGGSDELPEMGMTTYTYRDGVPHATTFAQSATGVRIAAGGDGVTVDLGGHPVAKELASLGLPSAPVLTTWMEHLRGTFEVPRPVR